MRSLSSPADSSQHRPAVLRRPWLRLAVCLAACGLISTSLTAAAVEEDAPAGVEQSTAVTESFDAADNEEDQQSTSAEPTVQKMAEAPKPDPAPSADQPDEPVTSPEPEEQAEPAVEETSAPLTKEPATSPTPETIEEQPKTDTQPAPESAPKPSTVSNQNEENQEHQDGEPEIELVIPKLEETIATITVQVGADRKSHQQVSGLSGVTLRLHDGESSPGAAVTEEWARCVSDATGRCTFHVPHTHAEEVTEDTLQEEGENRDRRFWIVAEAAPTGWHLNTVLSTGNHPTGTTGYHVRTSNELRAHQVYQWGQDFSPHGSGSNPTSAIWPVSRANPQLAHTCQPGMNVAIVVDLSGQAATGTQQNMVKQSAEHLAQDLTDSGATVTKFTANMGHTNWDSALWQVASDSTRYDLAVVVTNNHPTRNRHDLGSPQHTSFADVEQAVFSANAVKAQGTRVLAVGVGPRTAGNTANLQAISGPVGGSPSAMSSVISADHVTTTWNAFPEVLTALGLQLSCQATVEITSHTLAYGDSTPKTLNTGWSYTLSTGGNEQGSNESYTTGPSGSVSTRVQLPHATSPTHLTVESALTSAQQDGGWDDGAITCTVNGKSATHPVQVTPGDAVACTVLHAQTLRPEISITKTAWNTPTAESLATASLVPIGSSVRANSVLTWTYTVSNTGETTLNGIDVTDSQLGSGVVIHCPKSTLATGESMTCTASAPVTAIP